MERASCTMRMMFASTVSRPTRVARKTRLPDRFTVPPVTVFTGISMYTQWLVADPQSPNGMIALSHGLWHVFG